MVAQASPLMRLRSNLMAGRDSCSLLSSVFGLSKTRSLTTSEAVMRDEAIVLLAAASSIVFSVASVARAKPDLQQRLESTHTTARDNPVQRGDRVTDLVHGRPTASPRMIIWSVCGAPSGGSALSMYSRKQKPARSLQGSATPQDVPSRQCADEDEEGREENSIGGK
jgi:hypothetical protein